MNVATRPYTDFSLRGDEARGAGRNPDARKASTAEGLIGEPKKILMGRGPLLVRTVVNK